MLYLTSDDMGYLKEMVELAVNKAVDTEFCSVSGTLQFDSDGSVDAFVISIQISRVDVQGE